MLFSAGVVFICLALRAFWCQRVLLHRCWVGLFSGNCLAQDCRYSAIASEIEHNQPTLAGQLEAMCEFVRCYSGGELPVYLNQLQCFSRTMTSVRRDLPAVLFKILSETPFSEGPEYIMAILKASLRAPEGLHRENVAKIFTGADTVTITTTNKMRALEVVAASRAGGRS